MATITYGAVPASRSETKAEKPGFFARFLERLVEARSREANRLVKEHLLSFDGPTLARLGYDRDALIRAGLRDYI